MFFTWTSFGLPCFYVCFLLLFYVVFLVMNMMVELWSVYEVRTLLLNIENVYVKCPIQKVFLLDF